MQRMFTSGSWTSVMKRPARFSSTMPSEAAKKARMCFTKCFSSLLRLSQWFWSALRSTSSAAETGNRVQQVRTPNQLYRAYRVVALLSCQTSNNSRRHLRGAKLGTTNPTRERSQAVPGSTLQSLGLIKGRHSNLQNDQSLARGTTRFESHTHRANKSRGRARSWIAFAAKGERHFHSRSIHESHKRDNRGDPYEMLVGMI